MLGETHPAKNMLFHMDRPLRKTGAAVLKALLDKMKNKDSADAKKYVQFWKISVV